MKRDSDQGLTQTRGNRSPSAIAPSVDQLNPTQSRPPTRPTLVLPIAHLATRSRPTSRMRRLRKSPAPADARTNSSARKKLQQSSPTPRLHTQHDRLPETPSHLPPPPSRFPPRYNLTP